MRASPHGFDFRHGCLGFGPAAFVGEDDVGAVLREVQSSAPAQSAAAAGDEGDWDGGGAHRVLLESCVGADGRRPEVLSCDALRRGAISAYAEQKPHRRSAQVLSVYNSMAETINRAGAARLARLRSVVDLGDEAGAAIPGGVNP